jgi:hypothetical protein
VHVIVVVAIGQRTLGLLVDAVAAIVDLVPAFPAPAGEAGQVMPFTAIASDTISSIPILDLAAIAPATAPVAA